MYSSLSPNILHGGEDKESFCLKTGTALIGSESSFATFTELLVRRNAVHSLISFIGIPIVNNTAYT